MRRYPNNSPRAAARILVVALLSDGHVCKRELQALDRVDVSNLLDLQPGDLQTVLREYCEDQMTGTHLSATPGWLRYRLPERFVSHRERPVCLGQKQVWFLLRLVGTEQDVRLDLTDDPEFDQWRWVDFWYPMNNVVAFKRRVYERALHHVFPAATQLAAIEPSLYASAPAERPYANGSRRAAL